MNKKWKLIGRDVLVSACSPGYSNNAYQIALRLSCVTQWEPTEDEERTRVRLNDGKGAIDVLIPFDEFTKIIAMTPIITASG